MIRCYYCGSLLPNRKDLKEHLLIHREARKTVEDWLTLKEKLVSSLVSNYPQVRYYKEGKLYNLAATKRLGDVDAIECHTKEEMEAINEVYSKLSDRKPYPDETPGRTIFDFNTDSWVTVNSIYEFIDSCF